MKELAPCSGRPLLDRTLRTKRHSTCTWRSLSACFLEIGPQWICSLSSVDWALIQRPSSYSASLSDLWWTRTVFWLHLQRPREAWQRGSECCLSISSTATPSSGTAVVQFVNLSPMQLTWRSTGVHGEWARSETQKRHVLVDNLIVETQDKTLVQDALMNVFLHGE